MERQKYIDILKAIKNFEISKANIDYLHDVQCEFDNYLQKLLKMGDEIAVHYLMSELHDELSFSKQIEGERMMSPQDILNNNLIILGKFLTNKKICKVQRMFLESQSEKKSEVGEYRTIPVFIPTYNSLGYPDTYQAPDASLVPEFMKEYVTFFNRNSDKFIDNDPFIKSALLHALFVTIHPFRDGNGRTARLLQNLKFTSLVNKTYSDEEHGFNLNLQICPLNVSYSIFHNKTSYYQRLGAIQLGDVKSLNEAINSWVRFLLYMYEEQLNYIKNTRKIEKIAEIKFDEFSSRLLSSIFSDEHYGRAISEEEWQIDENWRSQNSEIIEEVRQIIKKDPVFKSLSFEAKLRYVNVLLDIDGTRERIENKEDDKSLKEILRVQDKEQEEKLSYKNKQSEEINFEEIINILLGLEKESEEPSKHLTLTKK